MALSRGARRAMIGLGVLALLVGAVTAASPLVARYALRHYLHRAGIKANIGNVDVNLFTGSLAIAHARGHNARDQSFAIGRLALSVRYLPLFSHRLRLRALTLKNARIDVRRGRRGALRIAGLSVVPAQPKNDSGANWGVGLRRLSLHDLRIDYGRPAIGGQAPIRRRLTINSATIRDIQTWRAQDTVSATADITVAGGRLRFKGRFQPFARAVSGDFDLSTHDLALGPLAPIVRREGIRRLAGRVDSALRVRLDYDPAKGCRITLAGHARAKRFKLARRTGPSAAGDRFDWRGKMEMNVLRAGDKPGTIATRGKLHFERLRVDDAPYFTIDQAQADWQGQTRTRLRADAEHVATDGRFTAGATAFAIPKTARFDAEKLNWQGRAAIDFAALTGRRAKGRLHVDNAKLKLTGRPLAITAGAIAFDGRYQEQPRTGGRTLKLGVRADLTLQDFKAIDTAIGAPWFAARRARADKLMVDGLNAIALARVKARGFRLFGDTDTDSAVMQAATLGARGFNLKRLRAYRLGKLDIAGADIHLRRDRAGLGVLSQFFRGKGKKTQAADHGSSGPGATYAADHVRISGAAVHFTDTTVSPEVRLGASRLTAAVDGVDTATPTRPAHYRLSADLGRYGHFDSGGRIAPLAPQGAYMNLKAYMRSLALVPLSGYLNAAMGRQIANGAANSTLDLKAAYGQLHGKIALTLSNFRLGAGQSQQTNVALGVSLGTALALVRSKNGVVKFSTAILGDITEPYFSMANLTREAILAGLRKALTSIYSPLGLLNKAKNAVMGIGRALSFRPIAFKPGKHYVPPDERGYLAHVDTAMRNRPGLALTIAGHAVPADAAALSSSADGRGALRRLARQRAAAVRDYLAARNIAAARLTLAQPAVDSGKNAKPRATLALNKP